MDKSESAVTHQAVTVYWRRGCPWCISLRATLRQAGVEMTSIDIRKDPQGASAVRALTGGNESVPTVVIGTLSWVNPSARVVLDALRDGEPPWLSPNSQRRRTRPGGRHRS